MAEIRLIERMKFRTDGEYVQPWVEIDGEWQRLRGEDWPQAKCFLELIFTEHKFEWTEAVR